MILDVFPSYKDKDMVDLLYQFERATGSSLNILVEKYLERMLYEKGYLTAEIETPLTDEPKDLEFETKYGSSNYQRLFYGELSFGMHKSENIDEIIEMLSDIPKEQLPEFAKNNWDNNNGQYSYFLKAKLRNPSLSVEQYLHQKQMKLTTGYSPAKERYYINNHEFSFGKYVDKTDMMLVKKYIEELSFKEFEKLKEDLKNCSMKRSKCMLKIVGRK